MGAAGEFLAQEKNGKPVYLWFFWTFSIGVPLLVLPAAMVFENLVTVNLSGGGINDRDYSCGALNYYSSNSGSKTNSYRDDCGSSECKQMAVAGDCWLGFNIMSLLGYLFMVYVAYLGDWSEQQYDAVSVNDTMFSYIPIPFPDSCGMTSSAFAWAFFWQFLGLFVMIGEETCSTKDFWKSTGILAEGSEIDDFSQNGGWSMAFGFIALISTFTGLLVVIVAYATGAVRQASKKPGARIPKPSERQQTRPAAGSDRPAAPPPTAPA